MTTAVTLATGAVFDSYRVLGMLATGHMGAVYSVEEVDGGKQRALKLLHPNVVLPGFDAIEFDRALRLGRELDREHYVEVVKTGHDGPQNMPWVVMQLLRGDNSKARVASKGPLGAPHLTELFDQVCRALQKSHDRGLAHGDLKPENVFMASARRVGMPFSINLLDYGVARFVDTGEKLWKAPEQQPGNCADPRLDVWSLGLIAFYLLTGRSFWDSPDATDPSHGRAIVPPSSHVAMTLGVALPYPQAFDTWFQRCVAQDPSERFENAAAVMKGLRRVLSGSPLADKQRGASILGGRSHAASVPDVDRAAPGRISHMENQVGSAPTHPAPQGPPSAHHPPTQQSPGGGAQWAQPPDSYQYPATQHSPPPSGAMASSAAPTQAAAGAVPTPSGAPTHGAYGPPPAPAPSSGVAPTAPTPPPSAVAAPSAVPTQAAATQQAVTAASPPVTAASGPVSQATSSGDPTPAPPSKSRGGALALGGCAVGVVVAVGGGVLLVVILIVVLVVASDDDSATAGGGDTTSQAAAAAIRAPVVGDEIELKQEVEAEFSAPGRGKAKLTESNHRRAKVLAVNGAAISRVEIEYLIKRSTLNQQSQPEPTQGKKYIVDLSGTPSVSLPGGGAPPAAEQKTVQGDGLDLSPADSLNFGELKVGQSVPAPAGLASGGMNVQRAALTFRGTKKDGATTLALFDVTLDLSQTEDGTTMSAKLSGSATYTMEKRLVSMELKGPVTIKAPQGTGTGFMKMNETRSYTDRP